MNAMPTYGTLRRDDGCWQITGIPPHVALRLKSVFPRLSKTDHDEFYFPLSPESSADLAWFTQRYPLAMTADDLAALYDGKAAFEAGRATREAILLPDYQPTLRPGMRDGTAMNQKQAVASDLLMARQSLLNGDDVGLGKTVFAVGTIAQNEECRRAAIVVQPHMVSHWVKHIKKFTYLTAHVIKTKKVYDLPPADIYIWKYSNIAGWVDVIPKLLLKSAWFDEIQELRRGFGQSQGHGSDKGKACKALSDNVAIRCGLSATPIFNYGDEMFNIVEILEPGALGTWHEFLREWCTSEGSGKWKVKDPKALGAYLRETGLLIRRLREGRKINLKIVRVSHDREAVAKSEEIAKQLAITVRGGSFVQRGQAARELDATMRHATGVSKAKSVADFARGLLARGIPTTIAGWHRDVYDIWHEELAEFPHAMYTGTESPARKDKSRDAFIAGEANPLYISLRSGVGLDGLQLRGKTIVIGELDWSPKVYEQLIGRFDRPGQEAEEIDVYMCVSDYGSDPVIVSVNGLKQYQSHGIMNPDSDDFEIIPEHAEEGHIKQLVESIVSGRAFA